MCLGQYSVVQGMLGCSNSVRGQMPLSQFLILLSRTSLAGLADSAGHACTLEVTELLE